MEKENVVSDSEKLKSFFKSLEKMERRRVRNLILEGCYIDYKSIDNWMYSRNRIPPLSREKIDRIVLREHGISLFNTPQI